MFVEIIPNQAGGGSAIVRPGRYESTEEYEIPCGASVIIEQQDCVQIAWIMKRDPRSCIPSG